MLALVNAAIMLILYGGLGFIGLKLSQKLGFADIWDSRVTNKQRFLIPALVGIAIGVFFIFVDIILSQFHTLGPLPHPPFPTSRYFGCGWYWRRNNISPVFHLVLGVAYFFCDLKEEMAKSDFLDCSNLISSCICFWAYPLGNDYLGVECS